ncbi:MAG: hypothetical protein H6R14_2800 [Proteobacteria bacterium]|nr:hypothetical protein [Pseudomonadota bacterium]
MKKVLAALGTAALLACGSANATISMSFTPSTSHLGIGDAGVIEARVSGLGNEILSAFDLNFRYNPTILNWTLVEYFGANLGNTISLGNNGLTNGDLGFDDSSLDDDATLAANQLDDFLLFRFTLVGLQDGVTNFTLGSDLDFERNFVGLNFTSLDVQVGSACIAVGTGNCATVPEPATYGLVGLALAGAFVPGALRRRREQGK